MICTVQRPCHCGSRIVALPPIVTLWAIGLAAPTPSGSVYGPAVTAPWKVRAGASPSAGLSIRTIAPGTSASILPRASRTVTWSSSAAGLSKCV